MGVWIFVEKNDRVEDPTFILYAFWELFFRLAVVWSQELNAIYPKKNVFYISLIWKESSLHA